jgi:H+/Cl- antiporter ClcA
MTTCFGSVARTPLGMMLKMTEMTGSLAVLAPAMIAVGIACLITRRSGAVMYRSQLRDRDACGRDRDGRALTAINVSMHASRRTAGQARESILRL